MSTPPDTFPASEEEGKAWEKTLAFLSYQPRTVWEMRVYLRRHDLDHYGDRIITRLQELGYLNDKDFATRWITERLSSKHLGRRRLKEELLKKGLPKDMVDEELSTLYDESRDLDRALELARSRLVRLSHLGPPAARRRLAQYLVRQGFSPETAWTVARELLADDQAE